MSGARWDGRLPYRIMLSQAPPFVDTYSDRYSLNRTSSLYRRGPFLLAPNNEFKEWASAFGIDYFEVIFWADIAEWKLMAANDSDYLDAWSVGFLEEKHLIFYKLRWT